MMTIPEISNIGYFLIASLVLIVMPGPAVLFIIGNSIKHGTKIGLVSVLGIGIGGMVHVIGAAIGLSAILVASTYAFSIVKYIGAIYLIFLGLRNFFFNDKVDLASNNGSKKLTAVKVLFSGMIVNIFNPKTAIFFLAFLPQFISMEKGHVASQLFFLGMLFIVLAIISDSLYVLFSVQIQKVLNRSGNFLKLRNKIVGSLYITLGILTLFTDNPTQSVQSKVLK